MTALPNLGLALAATGQYGEAMPTFAEARRLGREYGLDALLARAIAISTGFHNEVFDDEGAEPLSHEARDLARSAGFLPPAVSAGIDLLMSYARQGEIGRTERLVDEVAAAIEETGGFHGWQWRMRLAAARAEIALLRGEQEEALRWADETIAQSLARGRPKYEIFGLTARAEQRIGLGRTTEAIADLRTAVALARKVGDPALFVRPAAALLPVDGDDALAAEGRAVVNRIASALPDAEMRRRFERAEPVRVIRGTR
jgi:tetratricopeptide (TPR) repeat protein